MKTNQSLIDTVEMLEKARETGADPSILKKLQEIISLKTRDILEEQNGIIPQSKAFTREADLLPFRPPQATP